MFINNNPIDDVDILGLYSWGDFGLDVLSVALVIGDIVLAGPTGEGIAPAVALQGLKTGAKVAARETAKKAAKEAAAKATRREAARKVKERTKRIAECEAMYVAYDNLNCTGCGKNPCIPCSEVYSKLACFIALSAGRKLYLDKKCDYYLSGSISRGSQTAEQGHKKAYADASAALLNCSMKLTTCERGR